MAGRRDRILDPKIFVRTVTREIRRENENAPFSTDLIFLGTHVVGIQVLLKRYIMFSHVARNSARQLSRVAASSKQSSTLSASVRCFSVKDYREASADAMQLKTSFDLPDPAAELPAGRSHHQLTKIVATIGPTSEQLEPLQRVVGAGMKIMRLNFSHATTEEVELRMNNLAQCQVR